VSDTIARYGGEEFVLLLPETTKEGAFHISERIRNKVFDHPFPGRETQRSDGSPSVWGVATFPQDGADGSSLIERADKALYEAKKTGREQGLLRNGVDAMNSDMRILLVDRRKGNQRSDLAYLA